MNTQINHAAPVKKLILIAGIKRSGSTWMYNVVRTVLLEAGKSVHASNRQNYDPAHPAEYHILKIHRYDEAFAHAAWRVFTSFRNIPEIKRSFRDFTGRELQDKTLSDWLEDLLQYRALADLHMRYEDMEANPIAIVEAIANSLGVCLNASRVLRLVQDIKPPEHGAIDKETLLFRNHIADKKTNAGPGRLPDFLGIGAQKSGTTWLFENLYEHPEIGLPNTKELHFFDRDAATDKTKYARRFAEVPETGILGEITPSYATLSSEKIRTVRSWMPDVKLILLLRRPIERTWSHLRMSMRNGKLDVDAPREQVIARVHSKAVTAKNNYRNTLSVWGNEFPQEQMFVGYYDSIETMPDHLLNQVASFLGASELDTWPKARRVPNKGQPAEMPDWLFDYLWDLHSEEIEQLITTWGAPIAWKSREPL